ncbi:hypothetical protein TG4357_03667 [Thalassovita gelatinovora]|uniref:Uncharacterized protein n=1 Tax=Thalassovita gelatinovora TaxID=53501 RepID=A0A0P1FKJ3_THAGE|nr:hypothetical protein [Thalassovita gelatinovora]QIZ79008.1 hypothetical protein HFZ77_00220 [Thalassovita gelatinovora]CUH68561.1 hypothetical protein TG4357_03667 [Thalassovita gelatinovora]SEQ54621.1 hypothetical protein SAMN04488043_106128 [Thalassovita gelatinovora]
MSTEQPDASEAIKIALASAETASDAASLAEDTSKRLSDKADWVDRKLIPAAMGGIAGIILCAGLSAMTFYRTLGDLRTARDTHVEALHLFTQNVNQLKMTVEMATEMIEGQSDERQEITAALDGMNGRIETLETQLTESNAVITATLGQGTEGFAAHMSTLIEPQIGKSRDDVLAGISDLQLALSQKLSTLANQILASAPAAGSKPNTRLSAATPTTRLQPQPKKVTTPRSPPPTAPKPRKTTSNSGTNPFKYP